ncbi:redoxin domain-containing protein [Streptomyces sp. C10-9-1]|uniref:redoxin domain-containing protein n=1 Tax=Streptomyces sp. C10-9-1 TaxID=1859285 RepID=UPI003D70AA05
MPTTQENAMRARTLIPAAVTALVLALAGCGTDGGPAAGASAGPEQEASSPSAPASQAGETGGGMAEVPEALEFTATTVDGESFDARTLAGKPVVLWFWAPWCPKCKAQAEETARVAAAHRGEVGVVGVAGLDSTEAMKRFVDETGTGEFTHLSDENGEVWKRFEVTEQSRYVILDASGETVYDGVLPGGDGLDEKVAGLAG